MKKLVITALAASFGWYVSAQTIENVNLLNTTGLYGSPRFVGMGGAFTALGNDLSAMHLNPASGAVFRNNNFGLSLGFQGQTNTTSFLNQKQDKNTLNVLFQNIGLVTKFGKKDQYAFGVSYNKLADFNTDYTVTGINSYQFNSSTGIESGLTLGEYWRDKAYGQTLSQLEANELFEEASAYTSEILLTDTTGAVIGFDYVDDASNVKYNFVEDGSRHELTLNFGGDMNKKFYWGFGIGLPFMNYATASTLSESGFADTSYFNSVSLVRANTIDANGINLKIGAIYRPFQFLRIGLSYQSPSWYVVNEVYSEYVDGYPRNGNVLLGDKYIQDQITYSATSPAIYRIGLATVIGKHAIISADYEYSNPSKTKINGKDNNDYEPDEKLYQSITQPSAAIKLGGELRFGSIYLRGGYQYKESNFKPEITDTKNFVSKQNHYSGGIGFKKGRFGFDVAYVYSSYSRIFLAHPYLAYAYNINTNTPINDANPQRAYVKNDVTKGSLLLGFNLSF